MAAVLLQGSWQVRSPVDGGQTVLQIAHPPLWQTLGPSGGQREGANERQVTGNGFFINRSATTSAARTSQGET